MINKKIMITGGTGFVGTNLARKLVENNEVKVYDIGLRNALKYFTELQNHENFKIIKGDVLDKEHLKREMEGYDILVHTAAIAGVSSYYKMPLKTMEVNLLGTYNALGAAKETGLELLINFSSCEVYGTKADDVNEQNDTSQGEIKEKRWVYAISKLAGEKLACAFNWEFNLPIVTIRPFHIYGPGQVGEGAVSDFIRTALKNENIKLNYNPEAKKITGDGTSIRDWCYVDDINDAVISIMEKKPIGETFNIGNPAAACTILELAKKIISITNSKSEIELISREGILDIIKRFPNITKAENILGYKPKVSLEEGLRKTIEWYSKNVK